MTNQPSYRPSTVVYCAVSLDGFIARPDGGIDWLGDPSEDEATDENEDYGWAEFISGIDHILMGRATFEKVLELGTWPYEGKSLTVLSTTLRELPDGLPDEWGIANGAPGEILEGLAAQGVRRVYVDGGRTVQGFLAEDLIDELVLTTIPVLIGGGIPLFGSLCEDLQWIHTSTRTFSNGLVKNHYVRSRAG